MNGPVSQEILRLSLPERSGVEAVIQAADSVTVRLERLEHENRVLRERNAELEAALAEKDSRPRYGEVRSMVEGLRS